MSVIESVIEGVRKLTGIELTEDDLASVRHSLVTALLLAAHHKADTLSESEAIHIQSLWDGLLDMGLRAHSGEQAAQTLLRGAEKLIYPPKMIRAKGNRKEPFQIVNDLLAGYRTSPHLTRAWEVRRLMSELSFCVEPLQGSKLSPESKIKLDERRHGAEINKKLRKDAAEIFKNASKQALARMTLEGLAKKVYLKRLEKQDPNAKVAERHLDLALQHLREFEEQHPDELRRSFTLPVLGGERLPYQIVNQECKSENFF